MTVKFHHFGLATMEPSKATTFLKSLGYDIGDQIHDPEQNVNLMFCTHASMPSVEVILPGKGESPLNEIIREGKSRVYHICYEVGSTEEFIRQTEEKGLRVVELAGPKPAILFDGRTVSFHYIKGFGIFELLEA